MVVYVKEEPFGALIDTGSVNSYIGDNIVNRCKEWNLQPGRGAVDHARLANGQLTDVSVVYKLSLKLGGMGSSATFGYLPILASEMVVGMDILMQRKCQLRP